MSVLELNAEIYRAMGDIADDETMLKKVLKYIKTLAKKKEDESLMSREEFFKRVDEAKKGPVYELKPGESLEDLIERVD